MIEVCTVHTPATSPSPLTSEARHDGVQRAAHHRADLPPLPLPQNLPQHRGAHHQLPGQGHQDLHGGEHHDEHAHRHLQPPHHHEQLIKLLRLLVQGSQVPGHSEPLRELGVQFQRLHPRDEAGQSRQEVCNILYLCETNLNSKIFYQNVRTCTFYSIFNILYIIILSRLQYSFLTKYFIFSYFLIYCTSNHSLTETPRKVDLTCTGCSYKLSKRN